MKPLSILQKLFEMDQDDLSNALYDPNKDIINNRRLTDTRKKKLTLGKLNRLKKIRAVQKYDKLKYQDLLSMMYAKNASDDGGGFPM